MAELSDVTFLVVGAQRCGTTWVDEALRGHPQVYVPPQKQTYFFDRNYEQGVASYLANFTGAGRRHRAVGEVASGYCLLPAIPRMAEQLPHVKLIMAMRDPIDRAYSYYLSRRTLGGRRFKSFDETLEDSPEILARGNYAEQLELMMSYYRREQLLVLFYDDLVSDDRAYLRSILEFIGVDSTFESNQIAQRRHEGRVAHIRYRLERFGFRPLIRMMKRSRIGDVLRKTSVRLLSRIDYRAEMSDETRFRLLEYYAASNDRLGKIVGRDLSAWNR
jgi:Sulfotransferase domain